MALHSTAIFKQLFIMARLERPQEKSKNPSSVFLKWKSDEKCFEFWDKQNERNVKIELPFKALFLEHYHTVKGWHGATDKGIFSNEVYALGTEILNVKTFGQPSVEIASGIYKEIKDKVKVAGGSYHRSIYLMLEDGAIANLQLKGVSVGGLSPETSLDKIQIDGYSEFYNKNKHLLDNQFMVVKSFADGKKGATKFSIPVFEIGENISSEVNDLANESAGILQNYMNEYFGKTKSPKTETAPQPEPANIGAENEDDDFPY